MSETVNNVTKITEKDVRNSWIQYYLFAETGISWERLQALGFTNSLIPIFKKLYPKKEEMAAALERHLLFYNTEAVFGSVINGIVIALEEQRANGAPIEEDTITAVKSGLMGPMAGIGDSLDWATFKPIIFSLAASLSATGSPIGCFVLLLLPIIQMIIGCKLSVTGYKEGRKSVTNLLSSGKINELLVSASTLGLFMMGALSSTYVKLSTPLEFHFGAEDNAPFVLQSIFDGVIPGLLPLLAVLGIYWWLSHKNQNMIQIVILILVISIGGAFIGLL